MNTDTYIGKETLKELGEVVDSLSPHKIAILTDSTVEDLWLDEVQDIIGGTPLVLPEGEENKSLDRVKQVWRKLMEMDFTRRSLLIGLGGGVITDMAGFISSTFKRGTSLGLIPTTLMGQIDASIGGKTGFNFKGKNMIGTFYEPDFVLIDPIFLRTLPEEEIENGFGEVIKYAHLSEDIYDLVKKSEEIEYMELIERCADYKTGIVNKDLQERDTRRLLNMGHTIAHGIEKTSSFEIKHGNAVARGLFTNSLIAEEVYGFDPSVTRNLLKRFDMPVFHDQPPEEILQEIRKDKKNWYDDIVLILPEEVGKVKIIEVEEEVILDALERTRRGGEDG